MPKLLYQLLQSPPPHMSCPWGTPSVRGETQNNFVQNMNKYGPWTFQRIFSMGPGILPYCKYYKRNSSPRKTSHLEYSIV